MRPLSLSSHVHSRSCCGSCQCWTVPFAQGGGWLGVHPSQPLANRVGSSDQPLVIVRNS
jgi:hypothetical protein